MSDPRIAEAEAGSRELDRLVAIELGWTWRDTTGIIIPDGACFNPQGQRHHGPLPPWTTSVDAALTLVPEGWEGELRWNSGGNFVELGDPLIGIRGEGATLPLAIVIAALAAREPRHG